jgi:phospholipid/cholesterol/gamma-HCH transport system ATP-binding protein
MKTDSYAGSLKQETKNNNAAVIDVDHLKVSFGEQEVLRDVSFSLAEKENLVILGKSGTGKSVLIKTLVGLIPADSGSMKIFDSEITGLSYKELNELRKRIGFLFQSAALYDSMSVSENLKFPMVRSRKKITGAELEERIDSVLENVGLKDAKNKMPSELSGGMRKRIGLARTLIPGPEIMFYDEPTTGLDPVTSREISELINDVKKKYNTASIIITHDIACTKITADRILMLRDGEVYITGTYDEITGSDDEWIQSFFK